MLQKYDSTRLDQLYHDTVLFNETMEFLARFEEKPTKKNTCISSEEPVEILSDYFKDAKFSRG